MYIIYYVVYVIYTLLDFVSYWYSLLLHIQSLSTSNCLVLCVPTIQSIFDLKYEVHIMINENLL